MPIVKFYAGLRKATGITETVVSASTLRAALEYLATRFPAFSGQVWDGKGLLPHIVILINGRTLDPVAGLDLTVKPEDEIAIFPPIAGG
jgi:molybdopterin synthase sulfur carrier subunit